MLVASVRWRLSRERCLSRPGKGFNVSGSMVFIGDAILFSSTIRASGGDMIKSEA